MHELDGTQSLADGVAAFGRINIKGRSIIIEGLESKQRIRVLIIPFLLRFEANVYHRHISVLFRIDYGHELDDAFHLYPSTLIIPFSTWVFAGDIG